MRIPTSFHEREVEWLALALESLHHRDKVALEALADDEAALELGLKFERMRKRACGELRKRPTPKRTPFATITAIRVDHARGMTQAAIAAKHNVLDSYVSKVVRGLIRRAK